MIKVESVTYSYSGMTRPALTGISLSVSAGSLCALLGPNGSGKSTLLRVISGWLKPDSGSFSIEPQAPSSVAYLSQVERLPFSYSCLEYVLLGRAPLLPALAIPGPGDEEVALRSLEYIGMAGFEDRHITSLSGGEIQLVRIARCLAQEAAVILLDEPTSMLDPCHVLLVADTMRSLRDKGVTVLFSTHDINLAAALADQFILLKAGRIVHSEPGKKTFESDVLKSVFGVDFLLTPRGFSYYGAYKEH